MTEAENQSLAGALKTPAISAIRRKIAGFKTDEINAPGTFFYVKESDGPVLIALDDGPALPWDVGTGLKSEAGAAFSRLTIQNPFSDPITVVIYIGRGEAIDNRFTLVPSRDFALPVFEAATVVKGRAATTIAAGTTVLFDGVAALPIIRRNAIIVSNPDSALDLQFVDTDGNVVGTIFFRTSAILNVSGPIGVRNPNGSAVTCSVGEIWFVVK